VDIISESYTRAVTSHTAGAYYLIGWGGDDDPEHALEQAVFRNNGTVAIRIGYSVTGLRGTRYQTIAAGNAEPIEGPVEGLIVYNPEASTAGSWSLQGRCYIRNAGQKGGMKARKDDPSAATRYITARGTFTAGEVATKTLTVVHPMTITAIKIENLVQFSGGTITLSVLDKNGNNLLTAAYNLETPSAKTLTTMTLTASTDLLTLRKGDTIGIVVSSSAGGDAGGPLTVEIAHEQA
jgi:hypothetical protein